MDSAEEHKDFLFSLAQNCLHAHKQCASYERRQGKNPHTYIELNHEMRQTKQNKCYLHISLDHKKGQPRGTETLFSVGTV